MYPHQKLEIKHHLCPPKPNIISKNDGNTPANNTRFKRRTLTQEVMLSCMKLADTHTTPRQLELQKFPMKFLCVFAGAVLDGETGEIMEYCHLRISPQYKEVWGKLFGNEIGRLAQGMPGRVDGTNRLFFIDK